MKAIKIGIVGPSKPKWKNPEQYERMKGWIRDFIRTSMGFDPDLTIVSGHCPSGEEKHYCLDCRKWLLEKGDVFLHYGHKTIKVYTEGGVDTEAEIVANILGAKTEIYPAPAKNWKDLGKCNQCTAQGTLRFLKVHSINSNHTFTVLKGYHSRNIQIAKAVNVLYCIVPKVLSPRKEHKVFSKKWYCNHCEKWYHPQNGGCFTKKEADKFGKETHLVVIR